MVSSNKKKPSVSGQPNTASLVTVAGSDLDFYTNSNYLAYELAQYAAALNQGKLGSDKLDGGISEGIELEVEGFNGEDENVPGDSEGKDGEVVQEDKPSRPPSLSDIQVISNEILYDASNNPSAKIVFKVKNSSGVYLKSVNVRVEKK
jgi:hypothetical protein